MPDKRRHRGAHPRDASLFGEPHLPSLQIATAELCWLLSRGYASVSARKLVGDRHNLAQRQRTAVSRCACADHARNRRLRHQLPPERTAGQELWIDGYNVLTSVEAALSGGVILCGRDGSYRDMASVHGTYRRVEETVPAARLLGEMLQSWCVRRCRWFLDRPVSNSGRLKGLLLQIASEFSWDWQVELVPNPDTVLKQTSEVIVSSDSDILDHCHRWANLARLAIDQRVPGSWIVDLSAEFE